LKSVKFLSLAPQHQSVRSEILNALMGVYDQNSFVLGTELKGFEEQFAEYNQSRFAIGVGNGLDALTIALKSLRLAPSDEVIVPAHTYVATWLAVTRAGARIVPVEPDETMNIDPAKIEQSITNKTKVILPVHLYGQACDMSKIQAIADKHNLKIVEDNAQAIGSSWNGKSTGSFGIVNGVSFFPTKNLGAIGDGGAITTSDETIANFARTYRSYGFEEKNYASVLGANSRLDEMQAAVLRVKLKKLNEWTACRQQLAKQYESILENVGDVKLPLVKPGANPVYHLFVIRTSYRDRLRQFLAENGVETMIHYPLPPHLQKAYAHLNFKQGDFAETEKLSETILSLPLYPGMPTDDIDYVCETIKSFFNR
jgi:dTDP-4-amino-4,6-dideoxygalactose transaminase